MLSPMDRQEVDVQYFLFFREKDNEVYFFLNLKKICMTETI